MSMYDNGYKDSLYMQLENFINECGLVSFFKVLTDVIENNNIENKRKVNKQDFIDVELQDAIHSVNELNNRCVYTDSEICELQDSAMVILQAYDKLKDEIEGE